MALNRLQAAPQIQESSQNDESGETPDDHQSPSTPKSSEESGEVPALQAPRQVTPFKFTRTNSQRGSASQKPRVVVKKHVRTVRVKAVERPTTQKTVDYDGESGEGLRGFSDGVQHAIYNLPSRDLEPPQFSYARDGEHGLASEENVGEPKQTKARPANPVQVNIYLSVPETGESGRRSLATNGNEESLESAGSLKQEILTDIRQISSEYQPDEQSPTDSEETSPQSNQFAQEDMKERAAEGADSQSSEQQSGQ